MATQTIDATLLRLHILILQSVQVFPDLLFLWG